MIRVRAKARATDRAIGEYWARPAIRVKVVVRVRATAIGGCRLSGSW